MADNEQQSELPVKPKKILLRRILTSFLVVIIFIIVALMIMFSTDRGSKFLLDSVLERQQMIKYQYEDGNLLSGIILKNILVTLDSVDVKIDRADISLGWRAILQKEVHLRRGDVKNVQVILKSPPSDKPFTFPEIPLPFVLRVDDLDLDHLLIRTSSGTDVNFYDAHLKDTLWSGTHLSFKHTFVDMGYLKVKNAHGFMQFDGKYPLQVDAKINLPSLNDSLNIHDIHVVGHGTLDTIRAGFATTTPDLLSGWGVVQPMRDHVPMKGALNFKNYHLPFLTDEKLLAKKGIAAFSGNADGLNIDLNTDLIGEHVPQGLYQANLYTNYTEYLDLHKFDGQLLDGQVNFAGRVSWKDDVNWNIKGKLSQLQPTDKLIPQAVRDFLPKSLDANLASTGSLSQGVKVAANVDFVKNEQWKVVLTQKEEKDKKPEPMLLAVQWQGIDREMPYIGWLKSQKGEANIRLADNRQDIVVSTSIQANEKSMLPVGDYQTKLNIINDNLNIPTFSYKNMASRLNATAFIELPTEKRQLKWNALLDTQQFNPQVIVPAAPINLLNGRIKANGYAKTNQQIIQLNPVQLSGRLADQNQTVHLTGKSTAAILFNDEKQGGGFKSFAVTYDGALNAEGVQASQGYLKINVAGTDKFVRIHQFDHKGVAGEVSANGMVSFAHGIGWNIKAALVRFKPQYFTSAVNGEISGVFNTEGLWGDTVQRINVSGLNLAGRLNNKPLRGTGNLAVVLNSDQKGFTPQHFEANNLLLSYADNQIQATGNTQNLQIKINAPALYEIYSGLRGKAYGYINVQAKPRLKATANLIVDGFRFNDLVSIQQLRVKGELPTSDTTATAMTLSLDSLKSGERGIQNAEISIAGLRKAHVLKVKAENKLSQFYVQLAGGFTANNDWYGQIQRGDFDSLRTHLVQQQNASVVYNAKNAELMVGAHCWMSQQSQLCLDQPARVSAQRGNVSLITKNVNLADFSAFMPDGLAITGLVNGYAKASWSQGQKPNIDAKLLTQRGIIGITDEDSGEVGSNLRYDQIALIARSVREGLQLRLDVKTPAIGNGYANVVIDPYTEQKPMRGEIAFNQIQLKVFRPFIEDVRRLDGSLSFAGKISGTLSQPLLTGDVRLKDGAISMISLPVNLTNIQIYSAIRQNNATIDGAFNSGPGVGQLTGNIDWKDDPKIQLKLKGDKLLVRQVPLITAVVDTEVNLEAYPVQKRLIVQGNVNVPRALISMPESTQPVISASPDVRIIRNGQDQLALIKAAQPWNIRADIDVSLGSQVVFQGFDSRIPLVGRLYLTQRGTEIAMRANGAIGVSKKVQIDAYGQSLDLNRAIMRFNGPLDNPSLDIDTNKKIQGNLVGIRVSGTASQPIIHLYNDAGLSEQEALNALISGRITEGSSSLSQTEGFKSDVNNTIAAAGISMGLGGTRKFTNQIGRTLGLTSLALGAQGTGDDTQVSVTGYITPDLFIRYGVGVFTPVNKLTLRYQMNQRLYMEATQSLERAIDFFYNWRF